VHEHRNNTVLKIRINVTTSDGFEGRHVQNVVLRDGFVKDSLNVMVANAETDQKYSVKGQFRIRNGEFVSDNHRVSCVRG